MQFLYPSFLWALLLLAIPVIIHLFYFRRFKKVYFTNVKFLKEVKEETSSRNKLKNFLVLLLRLLALTFLVFAFAQPFIPRSEETTIGNNAISIFIDNSFSMRALSEDVALFDKAKDQARQIIMAFSEEDQFNILTHDLEARHQRMISKEDALTFIDEVKITPEVKSLNLILERQDYILNSTEDIKRIYLLTDFQQSITDLQTFSDSSRQLYLLPLQSVQEKNISIDSVWFTAAVPMLNQANQMIIRLNNHGSTASEEVQLSLLYQGQNRPLGIVKIPPKSTATDTINLTIQNTGWQSAEFKILDYPVQFDDTYKITFRVKEKINVLAINQTRSNTFLTAAFNGLSYVEFQNQFVNRLSYGELVNFDLIVLNEIQEISSGLAAVLTSYIENGGNVLLFSAKNSNIESYNNFLKTIPANLIQSGNSERKEVGYINTEEFIFSNVYESLGRNLKLPVSEFNFVLNSFQRSTAERLLSYRDGSAYLTKYKRGKGHFYLCSAPLTASDNDLVMNAEIFIPMLYKMAISSGEKQKIAYIIGRDNVLETDNILSTKEAIFKFKAKEEFIPGQIAVGPKILLDLQDQLKTADIYELSLEDELVAKYAFNYDRKESDLSFYKIDVLTGVINSDNIKIITEAQTKNLQQFIKEENKGIILWKWCISLVLIFLLLETLILRFWKK